MTLTPQTDTPRPKPNIDPDNAPFWEAVQRREFVLMQCRECGAWYWPAAYCRHHPNEPFFGSLEWRQASGKGRVFAYNVHHIAFKPAFKDRLPYVYALIELDEGPMFGSNIIDCDPQDVHVGMQVSVRFVEEDGTVLPMFRPDSDANRE
jgi:uncharacterized OB-fold protein